MLIRHALRAYLLGGVLVVASAAEAAGQGEPPKPPPVPLPPVEVVATRRPESPDRVPESIEVFSGDELRARGVTTLRDALALAAGVAIAPGGDAGPAGAVPEFWGLREFDAFLLVVDGVPWGGALNPDVATLSLRDVERVEVLRGPAPVTFGATSFVGVIHVVHNSAAATARYVEARAGSFGTAAGGVDIALPLSGAWSSRLSGDFAREGFRDDRTSFSRGHGLWRVIRETGDTRSWLSADVNVLRQDPASPHPREGTSLSTSVPRDANYNPAGAFLNNDRVAISAGFERPIFHGATWGATASYTHSAQRLFRGFLIDISDSPDNASGFRENIDINDVYADTHILWPALSRVRIMTGADLLLANGDAAGATFDYTVPLDGSTATSVAEPSTLDLDAEDERRFVGAYTSAEWQPIDRLSLSGGVRLNATSEKRAEGDGVTHTKLSGGVGALYALWESGVDHVRVFANYRNTFKPAAFDFGLGEGEGEEGVLEPETSRSYEGGAKVRTMDGRVDVDVSAFRMDFQNLVTATIVNGQPALINAGETRFKGVELATDVRLPHALHGRASYSFHDGRFVDFVQEFDGTPTQLGGNRFEMSARHLASLGLVLAPERGVTANAVVRYAGNRFLDKRNRALAPSFTTLDAGIGYRLDRVELRLNGRNLTNRRAPVSESELGDAQYYLMPARTIQTQVVLRY